MKILHILNTGKLSGAENVAADICMMFKNDYQMAYCSPDGLIRQALEDRDITYLPIDSLTIKALNRVISEYQPDLIDAHDVRATVLAATIADKGIPFISHLHVNNDDMKKLTIKSFLYMIAARKAKKIIAVSESCINDYFFKPVIKNKTIVLKNIIYSQRLNALIDKDSQEYCFDFIFLGRLTDQKNPQRIAAVASSVLKQLPYARFGVIGEGELKEEMLEIFEKEGVTKQVFLTGNLSYPYKAIKQANCMLFCSRFEGTPISALEAMYFGVPIVSTPTDGLIELIDNNITGYLSDDDDCLVSAIIKLIENKEIRKEMSEKQIEKFNRINNEDNYKIILSGVYANAIKAE